MSNSVQRSKGAFDGLKTQGLNVGQVKEILLGTPNRKPREYSGNVIGIYLPGSLYSMKFLLHSWGSLFGVPIKVSLDVGQLWLKAFRALLWHLRMYFFVRTAWAMRFRV